MAGPRAGIFTADPIDAGGRGALRPILAVIAVAFLVCAFLVVAPGPGGSIAIGVVSTSA